ncbi:TPA: hypothetical protein MHW15_25560 [Klebsiella pneumoniae]|nr:hypothetical protein [Klebsiella pneumoniae]
MSGWGVICPRAEYLQRYKGQDDKAKKERPAGCVNILQASNTQHVPVSHIMAQSVSRDRLSLLHFHSMKKAYRI